MNWVGQAHIGAGWAAFVGRTGDNRPHAHHALQILAAFEAPVALWTAADGLREVEVAIIGRDVLHALHPSNTRVGLLYVDAESATVRGLQNPLQFETQSPSVRGNTLRPNLEAAARGDPRAVQSVLAGFGATNPEISADTLIEALVNRLATARELPSSLSVLAEWTSLSASRLAHRFRHHTGLAVRPYLRWLRLQRAARAITEQRSITTAAHEAGFADAAHLSRTFQRHFGIAPSVLATLARSGDRQPVRSRP